MSNSGSRRALLECLAAIRDGRCHEVADARDELIRTGYALPADGRLRLTMFGLTTLWNLRDFRVAEPVALQTRQALPPGERHGCIR